MDFKKVPNWILALLSAALLSLAWLMPIIIFVAWVPLLLAENNITNAISEKRKALKITGISYLTFFTWNLCVTWWIYYASFGGACMAIICNSLLMTIVFVTWYNLKQRLQKSFAIWLLIPLWLGFEYCHTLWDLTWTWLTLGNAFAFTHNWVQWYEFTGTSGGSLWVLIVNILIFKTIINVTYKTTNFIKPIVSITIPIAFSYLILLLDTTHLNTNKTYKTLLIQPNIDPYNDKFNTEPKQQLHNLLVQLNGKLDSTIDYLVLPETHLTETIFEGKEKESFSINFLRDSILAKYSNLTIISGANTVHAFEANEPLSSTARKFSDVNVYYDSYNTGMQLNNTGFSFYHKSKLVPGVERMPFPSLFKPLEEVAINLGGTMGSLGTQRERTVFFSKNKSVGIAPVICYESVYPDYVAQYVRNGANLIFILTNDGWWENSPGHKQHLAYAKLRAIETRREIARCANTGISCFITPFGEIEQATNYWEQDAIVKEMSTQTEQTFFVRFGDLISYGTSFLSILLIVWSQYLRFKKS